MFSRFGDATGVERDVGQKLRIGALEKSGHTNRERVDRAKVHRHVAVGNQLEYFRQREVAVGTAEGKEQID
jgi:hypothetical protein